MSRRDSQNTRTHTKNEDTEEAALTYCTRTGSGALRKNVRYVYKVASCFSYRLLKGVEHWISRPTLRFCAVPQVCAQQLKPALVLHGSSLSSACPRHWLASAPTSFCFKSRRALEPLRPRDQPGDQIFVPVTSSLYKQTAVICRHKRYSGIVTALFCWPCDASS